MPRRRRIGPRRLSVGPAALGRAPGGLAGWAVFLLVLIVLALLVARKPPGGSAPEAGLETDGTPRTDPAAAIDDRPTPALPTGQVTPHLFLGNPSGARADESLRDNFLLIRSQYAMSYNDTKGTANWVSWRLKNTDLGDAPRQRTFLPDPMLPVGFYRVTHQDYTGSGFDRGHLCPHSDRDASEAASAETFFMSNIIPQSPNVNQRSWAMLEVYARNLVEDGRHVVFVITGPSGRGGTGSRGPADTIARGRVVVPKDCWKLIVVVPAPMASEPASVADSARVIAVSVPNSDTIDTLDWSGFRTSVAQLERQTGYRFLTTLRPGVAEVLRNRTDTLPIPAPQTPRYLR